MILRTETLDRCPLCGGADLAALLTAPDFESGSGDYSIVECRDCSLAFTNPRPREDELPKLYELRSSADFLPLQRGLAQRLRDFALDRYLGPRLAASARSASGSDLSILDFGCGDGALVRGTVRWGQRRAIPIQVTAVDFHDTAPSALIAAGPNVRYASRSEWAKNPQLYDAIFLRHVLEHHPQPLRLLGELAAILRPGGQLFIELPNRCSIWARIFRRAYFGYYLPRHLLHFDEAGLFEGIERAGLRCLEVTRAHTPLLGRSLGYLTGRDIGNTGLIGLASYPLQVTADTLARSCTTLRATAVRCA